MTERVTNSTWRKWARLVWAGVSVVMLETVLLGVALSPGLRIHKPARQGFFPGGFFPPVATKLTQSPWFLKTP